MIQLDNVSLLAMIYFDGHVQIYEHIYIYIADTMATFGIYSKHGNMCILLG